MKKTVLLLIFSFSFSLSPLSLAQGKSQTRKKSSRPTTSSSSKTSAPLQTVKTRYNSLSVGAVLFQENISAKRANEEISMPIQFNGLKFGYNYQKFYVASRFRQYHTAELGLGFAKGKGQSPTISDELKNQMWASATISPGFMYRTSSISDIGLQIPLVFRMIDWKLASNSGLTLKEKGEFSGGLGLLYINRFSRKNSLQLSVAYQQVWETTLWAIAWEHYL